MGFEGSDRLTPSMLSESPEMCAYSKALQNYTIGKLSQKINQDQLEFVNFSDRLTEIFSDKKLDVTSLFLVTPSVACVKYKLKDEEIKVSRRNQLIIGAQVTAFACQMLHESVRKLLHNNF